MTVSFFNESETVCLDEGPLMPLDASKLGSRRLNPRKRLHDQSKVNISSYNSAFLDGLFADVARVANAEDADGDVASISASEDSSFSGEDSRFDPSLSIKRSRVSLVKSFSRCARSYKNLEAVSSPVGVDTFPSTQAPATKSYEPSRSPSLERVDSLYFQLNCVDSSTSPKSAESVIDIIDMAFPYLPATVSDSSCNKRQDLTQCSDQQASDSETTFTSKESYGWFVDLDTRDDEDQDQATNVLSTATSPSLDLAFTAPTAPKRISNYDAEVEWAKAADTVDDVLGDFF